MSLNQSELISLEDFQCTLYINKIFYLFMIDKQLYSNHTSLNNYKKISFCNKIIRYIFLVKIFKNKKEKFHKTIKATLTYLQQGKFVSKSVKDTNAKYTLNDLSSFPVFFSFSKTT